MIADSGPLVAFFSGSDQYHVWAVDVFAQLQPPLLTCESVMTEAAYLLGAYPGAAERLLGYIDQGILEMGFSLQGQVEAVVQLMRRYRDQPMSLADACLVRMSELHEPCALLTVDSHFRVYRRHRRRVIPLICP